MRPLGPFARFGPAMRQVQRQTQTLAMTPQLRQAIQLLQLSNLELNAWLEDALETNPLLARDDGVSEGGVSEGGGENGAANGADRQEGAAANGEASSPNGADPAPLDFGDKSNADRAGGDESFDDSDRMGETAAENLWDGDRDAGAGLANWSGRGNGGGEGGEMRDYPQTVADKPPLREHLMQQIRLTIEQPVDRMIAAQLVDQLDEAGYLSGDLAALAATLGIAKKRLDAVVEKLLGLEPVGVFARNLAECLSVQLRDRNRLDPAMQALLANLETLARGDKVKLMRLCGIDAEDLDDMIAEIRKLDPRPAAGFDAPPASPLIPDVLMRLAPGAQGWVVELNPDTLPRLIVDRRYYDTVARAGSNGAVNGKARDAKRFLAARLQEANWLVRALDQRARTILKVATAIVERQRSFFEHGISQLRPLVLRDIADAIEVHESTVSRATANKYIATPRGTFELKFFFSTAVGAAANGEAHSAESIRHRIKSLIADEADILSDDAIVVALRREGYDLARRTVAKYREAMRIPSSVERRRMKALGQR